jgi:phytoene desaturase
VSAPRAVVVGAGIGGLATAIRLRLQGRAVTLIDRRDQLGGRAGAWQSEGFTFDTGPSHLMQLDPLRALFAAAGTTLDDQLRLTRLEPAYRVHTGDGGSIAMSGDPARLEAELERFSPGSGPGAREFLALGQALQRVGMDAVIDREGLDWAAFLQPRHWPLLARGVLWRRLGGLAGRYFADERLRQAFTAQALYMGMDPARAPGIYALLPHVELAEGLYFPQGGMRAIPEALGRLAVSLGVVVRLSVEVAGVRRDGARATGVALADGTALDADLVVLNADLPSAYARLLGEPPPRAPRLRYTCGAFVMLLGVKGATDHLLHHNLFLPADMRGAMHALFTAGQVGDDPVVYLSNPTRTDPSLAPEGHETLFVLAPVPNLDAGIDWAREAPALADRLIDGLGRQAVPNLRDRLVVKRVIAPPDWARDWRLARGAAFGLDHGLDQMSFMRPHNRHARLSNVYFVGASTHPGSGIPLVLTSARLVAERIGREQPGGDGPLGEVAVGDRSATC